MKLSIKVMACKICVVISLIIAALSVSFILWYIYPSVSRFFWFRPEPARIVLEAGKQTSVNLKIRKDCNQRLKLDFRDKDKGYYIPGEDPVQLQKIFGTSENITLPANFDIRIVDDELKTVFLRNLGGEISTTQNKQGIEASYYRFVSHRVKFVVGHTHLSGGLLFPGNYKAVVKVNEVAEALSDSDVEAFFVVAGCVFSS